MPVRECRPFGLKPGDVVVAVDGCALPKRLTVDREPVRDGHTVTVHYERVRGSVVEWQHYLEPDAAVQVHQRAVRFPRDVVRCGAALRMLGPGEYETHDGLYRIELVRDDDVCGDEPHPVRFSAEMRQRANEGFMRAARELADERGWNSESVRQDAILRLAASYAGMHEDLLRLLDRGAKGYLCEGDSYHLRDAWRVWDVRADECEPRWEPHPLETMADAVARLLEHHPAYRAAR